MKKLPALFFYAMAYTAVGSSCMHNDHDTSISYKESENYYSMKAHFSKSKTRAVDEYMDGRIGKNNKMSFLNSQVDGKLTLDDHTIIYMVKSPGILEIKLDKDKNSYESYDEIKSLCQGIKKVLTK